MFTMTKKKITTGKEYKKAKDEVNEARRAEMRRLYYEEKWELEKIAEQFDVSVSMVSRIIKGER